MAPLRSYRRFLSVVRQFLPLALAYARDRRRFLLFGGRRRVDSAERTRRARVLLDSFITLGPTFIKIGQLLSTRPDVLPPEYVEVLSELQDRVPPAPWSEAREVVAAELGDVDDRFDDFDTDAISGASLGQVYRATVAGEPVAVKVRRPGVEALVEADMQAVRWTLPVVMLFVDDARAFSLRNLADEFEKTIREEMDYAREATMLTEIRDNFAGEDGIVMPRVVESHSGATVLTMEYVGGTKITDVEALDAMGIDRSEVATRLQRAYLKMVLADGVFHADPHPGNLAVQDDGTIVFYDFGMSGRVDERLQEQFVQFYVGVANQDIDAILDTMVTMGTLSPEADRATMAEVTELAIQQARGEEVEVWRVQQIVERIEDTVYEFPLRLPSNMALVLRMASVVEGVCLTLDPEFDFIAVATDYLAEQGYMEESARRILGQTADQVRRSTQSALRTPPKLERMLDRFDRDDFYVRADVEDSDRLLVALARRLVLGMLLSAGVLSTALLYAFAGVRPAAVAGALSAVVAVLLYWSFRRRRGIRAPPEEFTRRAMGREPEQ